MNPREHPTACVRADLGPEWTYLGWQGWGLRCPSHWNPVVLGESRREGSTVLADLDGARLELAWQTRPRHKRIDLARTLEPQTARLTGRIERHELDEFEGGDFEASELVYDRDSRAAILALASPATGRAAVLRLSLHGVDQPMSVARNIVASLDDHPGDEFTPWAVYGLAFWQPPNFELTLRNVLTGSTRLGFASGRRTLSFWRVSPRASAGLQNEPDRYFARAVGRKERRWYRFDDERRTLGDHRVTVTIGRMPVYRWPGQWPRRHLLAWSWSCPESEQMYEVAATDWRLPSRLVEDAAEGLLCHLPQ
jgi:hypothetical protein